MNETNQPVDTDSRDNQESLSGNHPVATAEPINTARWVWLIPALAAIFVLVLLITYVIKTGPVITVVMDHGHGLKAGDILRCRGIEVGKIQSLSLNQANNSVELEIRLVPTAKDIARQGSRFWVVRPHLGLTGIGGLETIAGPRYMAVLPGTGPARKKFVALEQPPVVEEIDPHGLEILLTANQRGSLKPGSPIMYRQVPIGTVLSVGLASDASSVQVRCYIQPEDVALVRDNTKFWNVSGAQMHLGLTGLNIEVESIATLLDGGIALATPDPPGQPVGTGYRFALFNKPNDEWLTWKPALSVGTQLLPPNSIIPDMQRVTISHTAGKLWKRTRQSKSWALPIHGGLLAPASLLGDGLEPGAQIEVAGQSQSLTEQQIKMHGQFIEIAVSGLDAKVWPGDLLRTMQKPEDCVVMTDPTGQAMPLAATRIIGGEGNWRVDPAISLTSHYHGAAVLARSDGALLGLLLVNDGAGSIVTVMQSNADHVEKR